MGMGVDSKEESQEHPFPKRILLVFLLSILTLILLLFTFPAFKQNQLSILTAEERAWLDDPKNSLRLAPEKDYAPFTYVDQGVHKGLSADYLRLLEEKLDIQFKIVEADSLSNNLKKIERGEVDLLSSLQENPKRSQSLLFTSSYIDIPTVILMRGEAKLTNSISRLSQLEGQTVGVGKNYAVHDFLKANYPKLTLKPLENDNEIVRKIALGELDAGIVDVAAAFHAVERTKAQKIRIAGCAPFYYKLSFACRKDKPILQSILQKGLMQITAREREALERKWIYIDGSAIQQWRLFWYFVIATVTTVLVLSVASFLWNRTLVKIIKKKSAQLKAQFLERQKIEKQALQMQKFEALGQLAAGVAHDFRNELTLVEGYCSLLELKEIGDEHRESVQQISKAARRSAELTDHLLTFSRKAILNPRSLNLNDFLRELSQALQRFVRDDIDLVIEEGQIEGLLWIDRSRFEQTLMNLIVNSQDALPNGGQITLKSSDKWGPEENDRGQGNYLRVEIIDNGIGMSEEILERIFDPFFTTKELGRGTGLGLAMVYGFVQQSKGFIHVESKPGHGTRVVLEFPKTHMTEEKFEAKGEAEVKGKEFSGTERVLIVEDDASVRAFLSAVLNNFGYQVSTANNGLEALELIQSEEKEFDLLLCDVIMPKMKGPELVKRMKAPRLKVLFISGNHRESLLEHGLLPEQALLLKPFSAPNLAAEIRKVLGTENPAD